MSDEAVHGLSDMPGDAVTKGVGGDALVAVLVPNLRAAVITAAARALDAATLRNGGSAEVAEIALDGILGCPEFASAMLGLRDEPEPEPEGDPRPHSRACGIRPHKHGWLCHPNCLTCHGGQL